MSLRRNAPYVALAAALALTLARSTPAQAAGVATFRLANIDPTGTAPVNTVLARIKPPSTVVPRDVENDPPTILPEDSGYISTGFDHDALELGLIDGTTDTGDPFQVLKIDFGENGFGPGGRLFFQLNKAEDFDGDIELILPESVTNLAIEALDFLNSAPTPPTDNGVGSPPPTPPTAQVPEPASVVLWISLIAVAGLVHIGRTRRRVPSVA